MERFIHIEKAINGDPVSALVQSWYGRKERRSRVFKAEGI